MRRHGKEERHLPQPIQRAYYARLGEPHESPASRPQRIGRAIPGSRIHQVAALLAFALLVAIVPIAVTQFASAQLGSSPHLDLAGLPTLGVAATAHPTPSPSSEQRQALVIPQSPNPAEAAPAPTPIGTRTPTPRAAVPAAVAPAAQPTPTTAPTTAPTPTPTRPPTPAPTVTPTATANPGPRG